MRVKAYKNKFGYVIIIDTHVYEMNTHANLPDGVNFYQGEVDEDFAGTRHWGERVRIKDLPEGVKEGIKIRKQMLKEERGL